MLFCKTTNCVHMCIIYCRNILCILFHYSLLQTHPEVAMDSVVHIIQNMNAQQRTDVLNTLHALDTQIPDSDLPLDSNKESKT